MKSSFFFGVASVTLSPSFVSFSLLSLVLEWTRRPVCRSSFSGGMSSIEVASILVVASLLFSFYPSNKNRQSSCHLSRKIMLYVLISYHKGMEALGEGSGRGLAYKHDETASASG